MRKLIPNIYLKLSLSQHKERFGRYKKLDNFLIAVHCRVGHLLCTFLSPLTAFATADKRLFILASLLIRGETCISMDHKKIRESLLFLSLMLSLMAEHLLSWLQKGGFGRK